MSFDIVRAFSQSLKIVRRHATVAAGLKQLLAAQRRAYPEFDWRKIEQLDYAGDAERLFKWLRGVLKTDPLGYDISGLWFGLFDPVYGKKATRGLYVAGSERFDPSDTDNEWPVRPEYFPDGRYVSSRVLESLYAASAAAREEAEDVAQELDYTWCLTYAGLWIRQAVVTLDRDLLLGGRSFRGIGFGFDSGDLTTLGILREKKFELIDP
jgi:hypothetical protein